MKHVTIIMSSILLISSYALSTEYPHHKKLSRKSTFKSSIILLNQLEHYDIATEDVIINPGESKRIYLPEDLNLKILIHAFHDPLTLNFQNTLPQNICFTEKSDLIEMTYDGRCIKSYICK